MPPNSIILSRAASQTTSGKAGGHCPREPIAQVWRGRPWLTWLGAALAIFVGQSARAGGGPENLFLVVNSNSAASQTIANYFIDLRHLPATNVMYIDWRKSTSSIDVNSLRNDLFVPIKAEIAARGLAQQIDGIIYSADFPWKIDFSADVPAALAQNQFFANGSIGSLTGMTYMMGGVETKEVATYVGTPVAGWFANNFYLRLRDQLGGTVYEVPRDPTGIIHGDQPPKPLIEKVDPTTVGSHGFRAWYGWGPHGELIEAGGNRYMLSTMLGVTFGRGNTVQEIVHYLQSSARLMPRFPPGPFTSWPILGCDPKRDSGAMQFAVDELKQLGIQGAVLPDQLPQGRSDVQGLMFGVDTYNWNNTGSTIRPGAICESLTSWSGNFDVNAGQTPISELLRNGAAGSSGTVNEPFAIQNKFPYAMIQVHYARGCTLAESFYQSVYAPYQLIVVGDPLCRPWANIPQITASGAATGDTLNSKVLLHPLAKMLHGGKVDRFELFVDGVRVAIANEDDPLTLNTADFPDGDHELRVVGIENSAIESQGRQIIPVRFDNNGKTIRFSASPERNVRAGRPITLTAEAPGARGIAIYQNDRLIAKIVGEKGEATVDSKMFGEGPITLVAKGWGQGGATPLVYSAPIHLTIEDGGK